MQKFTPETKLWRYIRLSTLFQLFDDRVFVPSIANLRRVDPTEASFRSADALPRFQNPTDEERGWLFDRAANPEAHILRNAHLFSAEQVAGIYFEIWARELAKRRYAWCWHAASIQSMAQWHIYARDGVAIGTTAKKLWEPLVNNPLGQQAQIRNVEYVDFSPSALCPSELTLKPYFVKQLCYQHESEVRLVFAAREGNASSGLYFHLPAKDYIEDVIISPLLPDSEASALRYALEKAAGWNLHVDISDVHSPIHLLDERLDMSMRAMIGGSDAPKVILDDIPQLMNADLVHM